MSAPAARLTRIGARTLFSDSVDILRNPPNPERDAAIKGRQDVAGRLGFILGCCAAVTSAAWELYRLPQPIEFLTMLMAILFAALNMPVGIMLGLAGEKMTRPRSLRPPKRPRR